MRTKVGVYCDKVIEAGWLAAVVVVPLLFNIHSNRVFEPDKLSVLRSIALVMAAAWLIRVIEDWRVSQSQGSAEADGPSIWQRIWKTPLVLPNLLLVLAYLLSTALSVTWKVSLFGSYQRLQGTYTTLSYVVIFFLMLEGLQTKRQLNRLITTAILVSFPIALYGLVQHFGLDPLPWGGNVTTRVASNMGNAIFVAAFLIMVIPLTLSRLLENWQEVTGHLETRDLLLGALAFVLLVVALLVGMLWRVDETRLWVRWVALLVGLSLQVPVYLLSPADRRPKVLTISLPLTFAFLVGFSWILELLFPPTVPNYFWLGLLATVIFALAMVAFAYYLRKPVARLLLLTIYFVVLIAQLVCIFYTQSRGPLLGLLAGLFFYFAILGLIKRRVWIPWLMSATAIMVIIFLVMFNTVESPLIDKLREVRYVGRLGKVLQTEEGTGKVRILIWEGAVDLIGWHPPLVSPGENGGQDPFNAMRPIVGYGPEAMYVAYNRFYPPDLAHFEKRNASPDRSHNETFDALVTTGWIGLAAYLFLITSAFYYGLKWLGLIKRPWQKAAFIGLWIGGGIVGTIGFWIWRGPAYLGVAIPTGAMLGMATYVFINLLQATLGSDASEPTDGRYHLWILALLSAIVAHFVEIQFGIAIAATRTYFWVLSAAMVAIGTRLMLESAEPELIIKEAEAAAKDIEAAPRRRRRRATSPDSKSRPWSAEKQDWIGSVLTLSVMTVLILGTMLFDWITPQLDYPNFLTTLWKSLTESQGEPSLVMLALFLFTWLLLGLVGFSDLATRRESARREPKDWLAALGIFILVSFGGALIFALFHTLNLKPATVSRDGVISSPIVNTITVYYLFVLATMLILASVLAFLFRRKTIPWRWTGELGDFGVIASAIILPILVLILTFTTNVSIVRADIWYKQGLSSEKMQQWDAAIAFYEKATDLAKDEDFYYLFLGRALMEKGRSSQGQEQELFLQESETALQTARAVAPLNTDHSRNLSKLYLSWASLSQGEQRTDLFKRALDYSSDAVRLSPNTADVLNERAQIYTSMGDFEQAAEVYRQSLAVDDGYAKTYISLAGLYTAQEEWDKAAETYLKALELNPKSGEIYSNLGYVYSQMGDQEAALEANLRAVELRPNNYLDHQNLAILYYQMGRVDDAIREATEALALAPDWQKPSLESFLAQLGQSPSASPPADPQKVQELLSLGRTQMDAEDWAAAGETYRQILQLDANSPVAHSALAYIYARQGRLDEAITENLAVLDLLPDDYSSYKNLAILYRQQGSIDKAISATEKAVTLAPEQDREALQTFLEELRAIQGSSSPTIEPGARAGNLPPGERNNMYSTPPPIIIDPAKSYQATIVTEKGNIVLELYADRAPNTVNNFVFLARDGFYDNTTFHRVIPDFMAQGGDPTGTGAGGPGYTFADEFDPTLRHDGPGILSMANRGPNTNGAQFFITYKATPWLDDLHAVFGRVTGGLEVLQSLTPRDPQQSPDFAGDTILTIVIQEQ
jgi:cyclophilin family peptidyl-prolyl cis-trans isomerase/Flp pilus assembly protein TadD/O-antigen ligase